MFRDLREEAGGEGGGDVQGVTHRVWFGLLGLFGLSAPGLLAMGAVLPFWQGWRGVRWVQSALRGVNAAVVGVLLAALFSPLWTTTVHSVGDFVVALVAFVLLTQWRVQPIVVVAGAVALSVVGVAF